MIGDAPLDLKHARILLVVLLLTTFFGGCLSGGEIDPVPGQGDIEVSIEESPEVSNEYKGTVDFELNIEEERSFDHVMLCLYSKNGTLINSTEIGTFSAPGSEHTFEISASSTPQYFVVDHPGFREFERLSGAVVSYTEEGVREENAGPERAIDSFDYVQPADPGECGR